MPKKTSFEQWLDKNNDLLGKSILELGLTSLSLTAIGRVAVLLEMVYNAGYESAIRDQISCTEGPVKE